MKTVFIIIGAYFLIGAIAMAVINRRQDAAKRKENWTKYAVYLAIVGTLVSSIIYMQYSFVPLAVVIALGGLYEIVRAQRSTGESNFRFTSLICYGLLSISFILFSGLNSSWVLYTYLAVFVFDGFSQISGQLLGRRKLIPSISPNKTVEGVGGGLVMTIFSLLITRSLTGISSGEAILFGTLVSMASLTGDLLASFVKRKAGIKDYSKLIPGHGGFLDRFDSFIFAGAIVYIVV